GYVGTLHNQSHYVIVINAHDVELPQIQESDALSHDGAILKCQTLLTKQREDRKNMMMAYKDEMEKKQMSGRIIVKEGTPGETIVKYARDEDVDIIIIGCGTNKGRSTMEYVTQHANCPVTRVPPKQAIQKDGALSNLVKQTITGI
ncbi:unnamed protein product, partial [Owenia fusiformis]